MIAVLRKNLSCLISKHNSFVCKSHVSSSLYLHFYSTSRERKLSKNPRVYDMLVKKHHFSPQVALLVSSDLARVRNAEKADSMLSFLVENGFSSIQLEKIAKYEPQLLVASVENLRFKFKVFHDLGLSFQDIAKLITSNPVILHLSTNSYIVPSLCLLKGLLGSDDDVARLLRISGWFMTNNLEKTMVPNVEFLKSCGIPMERVRLFIYNYPRSVLIKTDILRKSVDKAKELGVPLRSKIFIHAVRILASMSKETWELKLQAFRDLGFSNRDILTIFRKTPVVFNISTEKQKMVTELLLATGKFDLSCILTNPSSLGCSIEKRYKPRLRVLGILESKNLINKWPGLSAVCKLTDDQFFKRFVGPYSNEVGDER